MLRFGEAWDDPARRVLVWEVRQVRYGGASWGVLRVRFGLEGRLGMARNGLDGLGEVYLGAAGLARRVLVRNRHGGVWPGRWGQAWYAGCGV